MRLVIILLAIAVTWLSPPSGIAGVAGEAGHYPTGRQPVGWRGDGTGAFPGATPVREWNAATGKNIAWRTEMPGPSFSQPIVVGDKVFTLADPNWLICVSAIDGRIIWQKAVDHTSVMSPELARRTREAVAFWDARFREYAIWADLERGYKPNLPREQVDQALKAGQDHGFAINAIGQANFDMIRKGDPLYTRLWKDQAELSLYYFGHWEGILTHTYPTPVSDGQFVYVNLSNDQIACYDLEGNCRWLIWDRPAQAKPDEHHVRYSMPPRLIGDRLVVAACGELRVYDKHTGKKLWGVFHRKDFGMYWVKVSPPVWMRLEHEGNPLDVLISPGSGVYRLEDGKVIGTLPELRGYEGSTALIDRGVYVRKDAPDAGNAVRLGGRFKVVSREQVEFEELWRMSFKTKSGNTSDVLYDGWIYSPSNGHRVEMVSGRAADFPLARVRYSAPVLGGRLLVSLGGGSYGQREKRPGVMEASVVDLDAPGKAVVISEAFIDRRYDEDQEFRLRWRWRGNGDSMSNSSPVFQGNRMFFRTAGYLWCIGDPRQPWVTPAGTPPAATVKR